MSRRDKRGRDAVSRRLTERSSQIRMKTQTANSVCGLERKKWAQRKRGSANSGDSFRRGRFCRASGGPIFSVLPEKMGEKRGAGMRLVLSASGFRRGLGFQAPFHSEVTLRVSAARRLIRGVSGLRLVALEHLQSIEGAGRICWSAPFCWGSFCAGRLTVVALRGMLSLQ